MCLSWLEILNDESESFLTFLRDSVNPPLRDRETGCIILELCALTGEVECHPRAR